MTWSGTALKWRRTRRALTPDDPLLAVVTGVAAVLSVVAAIYYFNEGVVLSYKDAVSHVLIAARVVDSPTAGVAQLGGVWLPLPHVLAVPFVWIEWFYTTGMASSIVSMASYVITVRYLYKIAHGMAGTRWAGVAAAAVFALNTNALYLQATPMTESLLFACIAGAVYHLQEWCQTGRYGQIALSSMWTVLATLTRYEGWVLCLAVTCVVGYTALRRWRGYTHIEANLIFFSVIAYSGIAAWCGWNWLIFGNPLYWQTGEYAKPSLWVSSGDQTVGDIVVSAQTYVIAMADDIGYVTLGLAALGVILYFVRHRIRAATLAPYALLGFLPFYIFTLYAGQRRCTSRRSTATSTTCGSAWSWRWARRCSWASWPRTSRTARPLVAVALAATVLAVPGTKTLEEPVAYLNSPGGRIDVGSATWLKENYDGGRVLMQNFGNELVTFQSQLPLEEIIYEGSFRMWEPALVDPVESKVRWIYMRSSEGSEDGVYKSLHNTPILNENYQLLYQDADRLIYRAIRTEPVR